MADTNLTSVAGILKRQYDDYVEQQQNLKHHTMDEFAKSLTKYNPAGEGFFGAIDDYGNEAIGAINEEEQFRTIDSEHYLQWKVIPKVMVAPIQFSGLVAKAADSDTEAFAAAVVDALDKARERLLKDENRQFFGLGNGVMGSPSGTVASGATSFTVNSAQYCRANQVVDIYTSAGGTALASGVRLQDVDKNNNVLILPAGISASLSATAVIVKQNILLNAPADGKESMGLRGITDDGTDLSTFQSISYSATTNLIWAGRRINAAGANLTSDLLQRVIDDVRVRGGDEPDSLIMHPVQRRSYLNLVVPQKRYMDGDMDTGYSSLEFNGHKMLIDEDCQADTVYALTKSMIRKFELSAMEMGTHDGSDVFLRLANFDQFQAYWRHYMNFGTSKRASHGKIVGLAVPAGAQ